MPKKSVEFATIQRPEQLVAGGRIIDHDQYASDGNYVDYQLCYSFLTEPSSEVKRDAEWTWDYAACNDGMLIMRS